jgi:Flp pilus assembly pilin Flp
MEQLAAAAQIFLGRFRRQDGQTMAEYAVILSVITITVVAALVLLTGNISTVINRVAGFIS